MSLEAVSAVNALSAASTTPAVAGASQAATIDPAFGSLVDQLSAVNGQMHANDQSIQALALGQGNDLHRVMMNLESTRLSFDLLLQVRNKVLDAYQELMRMQI